MRHQQGEVLGQGQPRIVRGVVVVVLEAAHDVEGLYHRSLGYLALHDGAALVRVGYPLAVVVAVTHAVVVAATPAVTSATVSTAAVHLLVFKHH